MAHIRAISAQTREEVASGWRLTSTAPNTAQKPSDLDRLGLVWRAAAVPGTVASALRAPGNGAAAGAGENAPASAPAPIRVGLARTEARSDVDASISQDLESRDWWYRTSLALGPATDPARPGSGAARRRLRFEGLATLADVFLGDQHVLTSSNMFQSHEIDVTELLEQAGGRTEAELAIRFRALRPALAARRPRPRWRTRLVRDQNLRWFRTSFLGRMPSMGVDMPAVGPYRPVVLVNDMHLVVDSADVRAECLPGEPARGLVRARLEVRPLGGDAAHVRSARLQVGESSAELAVVPGDDGRVTLSGELRVAQPKLWWPHTHGAPNLYPARALLLGPDGAPIEVDLGALGFRRIERITSDADDFGVTVNGVPVFCRGACWTTVDVAALGGEAGAYRRALTLARDAGMNMLRIPGNTLYEDDLFYELCDELGILVWQDFMFANLDYPIDDATFAESVKREVRGFLDRVQVRPCLAVLCGGSEVEQQAAMLGLDRALWSSRLTAEVLPEAVQALRPDVLYVPNSPTGGALPFEPRSGVTHYYGVGAYLRPLTDARLAGVRFASECLAFSNVPDRTAHERWMAPGEAPVHHPRWKASVPRDVGAGWDFEDVRDHYLRLLFGVDPVALRWTDPERYLELSRVVTGEVMAATFAEWRRPGSSCRGGLVWLYQDIAPGAGWGVVDEQLRPKPAWFALRRAFDSVSLFFSDEGLNGLDVHLVNDTQDVLRGEVDLSFLRDGEIRVAAARVPAEVGPRSAQRWSAAALLPGFFDTTYAYRFGPPAHRAAVALFRGAGERGAGPGIPLERSAFHFPLGLPSDRDPDLGLEAEARLGPDGEPWLWVRTKKLALAIEIELEQVPQETLMPEDNYFHLPPSTERCVRVGSGAVGRLKGFVRALNGATPLRIVQGEGGRS